MGKKPVFFRAKNLSVNTWTGPDICSLICEIFIVKDFFKPQEVSITLQKRILQSKWRAYRTPERKSPSIFRYLKENLVIHDLEALKTLESLSYQFISEILLAFTLK